jgi:hypothetical protein
MRAHTVSALIYMALITYVASHVASYRSHQVTHIASTLPHIAVVT